LPRPRVASRAIFRSTTWPRTLTAFQIEADVIEVENSHGQAQVTERIFVHNTAQPAHTQYNPDHGFEVVLPADAVLDGAQATTPHRFAYSSDPEAGQWKRALPV